MPRNVLLIYRKKGRRVRRRGVKCFRHDSVYTSASMFHCSLNVILLGQISEIRSQYLFKGPYKCSNKILSGAATLPLFSSTGEFIPWRPLSLACKKEVI